MEKDYRVQHDFDLSRMHLFCRRRQAWRTVRHTGRLSMLAALCVCLSKCKFMWTQMDTFSNASEWDTKCPLRQFFLTDNFYHCITPVGFSRNGWNCVGLICIFFPPFLHLGWASHLKNVYSTCGTCKYDFKCNPYWGMERTKSQPAIDVPEMRHLTVHWVECRSVVSGL